jgi:hypothetical protein
MPKPAPAAKGNKEVKSKLDDINQKLRAGYSVADVQKFQKSHSKGAKTAAKKPAAKAAPAKKKAAPVKKPAPKPAYSGAIPDRSDVTEELEAEKAQRDAAQQAAAPPNADDAQVDTQAEEIISQIKAAGLSIRGLGDTGPIDEAAFKTAISGMNLLQLDSHINS